MRFGVCIDKKVKRVVFFIPPTTAVVRVSHWAADTPAEPHRLPAASKCHQHPHMHGIDVVDVWKERRGTGLEDEGLSYGELQMALDRCTIFSY